jgi:hypothetical protein
LAVKRPSGSELGIWTLSKAGVTRLRSLARRSSMLIWPCATHAPRTCYARVRFERELAVRTLRLDLENCYGIKKLEAVFDFSACPAVAIYAPNGAMKSSLAKTFQDVADGSPSRDRMFPTRASRRVITDENGVNLPKDCVLVVRPYDEVLGHSEKTSTLLVNAPLREEYEALHVAIDEAKTELLKALKQQSRSKKDLEREISSTFTASENRFEQALVRIKDEIAEQKDAPFADVQYDTIFDDKVLAFLGQKDFKNAIEDYIKSTTSL